MKRLSLFLAYILLHLTMGGCTIATHPSNKSETNDGIEMSKWSDFSIKSKLEFFDEIIRDDGSVARITFDKYDIDLKPYDTAIYLYHLNDLPCSSSTTGTSKTTNLDISEIHTIWGRVDVWEQWTDGNIPDWENVVCTKDGIPKPAEVYMLCSQKNEKTVIICIRQMTDNPELAEEIFRTFKWTE